MSQWTTQTLDFKNIKHPSTNTLVITVGNYGYRQLISNFLWNIEANTDLYSSTVVFSYDRKLIEYVNNRHPTAKTQYLSFDKVSNFNFRDAVAFKETHWDDITLYKLYAIHWLLNLPNNVAGGPDSFNIFYSDADIYYIRSPLPYAVHEIKGYKMLIQEGVEYKDTTAGGVSNKNAVVKPNSTKLGYCSGMLYVPNNEITQDIFDPKNWNSCNMDDENYIKTFVKSNSYVTDVGLFRNDQFALGTIWRQPEDWIKQQIKAGQFVCIHFNYIKGIELKIAKMQQYKMWIKAMDIIEVPSKFQPNLNAIVRSRRGGHTFPPHQKDKEQIEEYAFHYVTKCNETKRILSEYDYLPIFWTAIGVSGDTVLKQELKDYITKLLKTFPNRKFWTIVQHCEGIYGSCGVDFPSNRIRVFGTTVAPNKMFVKSMAHGTKGVTSVADAKKPPNVSVTNTLHLVIPLICAEHPQNVKKQRLTFASFIGSVGNHPVRQRMQRTLHKQPGFVIEPGNFKETENTLKFRELMSDSVFALCPRGVGSTSYRLAEAMQFGAIPVYISDIFSLPFSKEIDWNSCCILVKPDDIPGLPDKLRKMSPAQIKKMQDAVKNVYSEYMTLEGCCKHLVKYI